MVRYFVVIGFGLKIRLFLELRQDNQFTLHTNIHHHPHDLSALKMVTMMSGSRPPVDNDPTDFKIAHSLAHI